ncbi:MAG TPA: beta-propeller domain-containing protein [Mycobacteriales bacterium]|nr:beta-propeller domain-containing protein [Mycobacteriales bacterium]
MSVRPAATRTFVAIGIVAALVLGLGAVSLLPGNAPAARAEGLTPYDDCGTLLKHYRGEMRRSATAWGFGGHGGVALDSGFTGAASRAVAGAPAAMAAGAAEAGSNQGAVGPGQTGTNVQEQGVDEPDLAKIVDGVLYVSIGNKLHLLRAGADPKPLAMLTLGKAEGWGTELLIAGKRALVVLTGYEQARPMPADSSYHHPGGNPRTTLVLVDVSDPTNPRKMEDWSIEGRYLSARLADGAVRVVTMATPQQPSAYPQPPHGRAQQRAALERNQRTADRLPLRAVLPQATHRSSDGTVVSQGNAVECGDVRHAENPRGTSTLTVSTFAPAAGLAPLDSTSVTTDGDIVYASAERLYVATSRWGTTQPLAAEDSSPKSDSRTAGVDMDEVTSELHAFDTSDRTKTTYLGSGSVPGYLMGRWALSHHEGHLRVATTRQPPWDSGRSQQTSSSMSILAERDGRLIQTGRVDGLGKTERIQAVRYFGDLAAVVTFRQTDPLYLLDLSDPADPKVTGELKVPGFSTYLHPVGGGRLIGVGQEATDQGQVTGMQVSLFDISDISRPRQVDRLQLGRGHSQALQESRAFGYDPERRLATLPWQSYSERGIGQAAAIGIEVDGDTLREVGRMDVHASTPPERVLADQDHVYAVSHSGIVAGVASRMERTGAVTFSR